MKPVQENNGTSTTNGCSDIISSNCITWQGNLPSCINYCPGDSLTTVIESIAEIACDALTIGLYSTDDITNITNDQITSFYELIQGIIKSIVNVRGEIGDAPAPTTYTPPMITLPGCIYDACETCTINSFSIPNAFTVGFETVCNMIANNTGALNSTIEYLTLQNSIKSEQISYLNTQINNINNTVNGFEDCITVTVGNHELTGPVAGEEVCASEAIEYLANQLSITIELLTGGTKGLISFYESIGSDFGGENSFQNPSTIYADLDGWSATPSNLVEFTSNLYTLVKDIWIGLHECCDPADLPCILIPPKNVSIDTVTAFQAVISWDAHGLTSVQAETNYTVEIYAYDGVQAVGPVLVSASNVTGTEVLLNTGSLSSGTNYIVKVTSNYNCGIASTQIVGEVKLCEETLFAHLRVAYEDVADTCNGGPYTKTNGPSWKIQLKNSGGIITNNTSGSPITVQIRVPVESPLVSGVLWEIYDLTIPHNSYEAEITTISPIYEQVLIGATCEAFRRGMNLVGDYNIEILKPASPCFVGVGIVEFDNVTP